MTWKQDLTMHTSFAVDSLLNSANKKFSILPYF